MAVASWLSGSRSSQDVGRLILIALWMREMSHMGIALVGCGQKDCAIRSMVLLWLANGLNGEHGPEGGMREGGIWYCCGG